MTKVIKLARVFALSLAAIMLFAGSAHAALDLGTSYTGNIGLGTRDLRETVGGIITTAMGLLGTIAVVIVLYGGFKWMTAGGDEGKVDEARTLIIQGVVGLAIILSAYAISTFVINVLLEGTGAEV